jgi:hypothetical protein
LPPASRNPLKYKHTVVAVKVCYLLKVFHDNRDRWMNYREPGDTDADLDDYDLIHKAWSATIGIRPRVPEPAAPGTYGGVVREWLPHQR